MDEKQVNKIVIKNNQVWINDQEIENVVSVFYRKTAEDWHGRAVIEILTDGIHIDDEAETELRETAMTSLTKSLQLSEQYNKPEFREQFEALIEEQTKSHPKRWQSEFANNDDEEKERERIHEAHERFQNEAQAELPFDEPTL